MKMYANLENEIETFYQLSVNMMDEQRAKNKVISKEFREFKMRASEEKDRLTRNITDLEGEKLAAENMLDEVLKIVGKTYGRKLIPEELIQGKVVLENDGVKGEIPVKMFNYGKNLKCLGWSSGGGNVRFTGYGGG
jgi:hypothetical protein